MLWVLFSVLWMVIVAVCCSLFTNNNCLLFGLLAEVGVDVWCASVLDGQKYHAKESNPRPRNSLVRINVRLVRFEGSG